MTFQINKEATPEQMLEVCTLDSQNTADHLSDTGRRMEPWRGDIR